MFRARKSKGLRRKPPVAARPGTPGGSARPCLPVRPAARACFRSRAFRPHPPDKTLYGLLPRPCASRRMRSESRTFRARKSKGLRRKPPVAARPGTPVRWKKKGRAADARSSAAHRLSKPPGKYERDEALANKKSTRRRVRRVREGLCARKSHFPEKNSILAVFAPGNLIDFSGNRRGWSAGEFAPPSTCRGPLTRWSAAQ